jgi:metal-responsive CopG/Arc/MetJ family transcriptional regulator
MEYLSITFPKDLKLALDQEARKEHIKRSTLIQKAVRVYLQLKKQQNTKNMLCEGYQEMYGISKEMNADFYDLDRDALKYVD